MELFVSYHFVLSLLCGRYRERSIVVVVVVAVPVAVVAAVVVVVVIVASHGSSDGTSHVSAKLEANRICCLSPFFIHRRLEVI